MSGLLLENDLRISDEGSEVRTLARARTLMVLGRLDPSRKTAVMQFLIEADLVQRVDGRDPIIGLSRANLSGAELILDDMRGADLFLADLSGAFLLGTDLSNANLSGTELSRADLSGAELSGADLSNADLFRADLSGAYLVNSNLANANLVHTDLRNAVLSGAGLSLAELNSANLSNADLSDAFLLAATGITNEELKRQAASIEGATMPNCQKYKDWLKSREEGDSGS